MTKGQSQLLSDVYNSRSILMFRNDYDFIKSFHNLQLKRNIQKVIPSSNLLPSHKARQIQRDCRYFKPHTYNNYRTVIRFPIVQN